MTSTEPLGGATNPESQRRNPNPGLIKSTGTNVNYPQGAMLKQIQKSVFGTDAFESDVVEPDLEKGDRGASRAPSVAPTRCHTRTPAPHPSPRGQRLASPTRWHSPSPEGVYGDRRPPSPSTHSSHHSQDDDPDTGRHSGDQERTARFRRSSPHPSDDDGPYHTASTNWPTTRLTHQKLTQLFLAAADEATDGGREVCLTIREDAWEIKACNRDVRRDTSARLHGSHRLDSDPYVPRSPPKTDLDIIQVVDDTEPKRARNDQKYGNEDADLLDASVRDSFTASLDASVKHDRVLLQQGLALATSLTSTLDAQSPVHAQVQSFIDSIAAGKVLRAAAGSCMENAKAVLEGRTIPEDGDFVQVRPHGLVKAGRASGLDEAGEALVLVRRSEADKGGGD